MKDFAIVKNGNAQYYFEEGALLEIPRIKAEEGKVFRFKDVLLLSLGGEISIGTPTVENAFVEALVIKQSKGRKKRGFKFKAKSRYRKSWGYRTLFTRLRIMEISNGAKKSKAEDSGDVGGAGTDKTSKTSEVFTAEVGEKEVERVTKSVDRKTDKGGAKKIAKEPDNPDNKVRTTSTIKTE